jgi:RimJ/RimL family protein N-acetyltransferase
LTRIDGQTVSLRRPRDADADAWVRAGVDPEISLGYGARVERGPIAPEDARARVRALQDSPWGWIIETADEVIGWASGPPLPLRTLHLRVADPNARAIASYRKCGFVEVGRGERAFELGGRWVADIVMCRELP